MLNQDIIQEATRLTRAGQFVEATALLQRMLRGESAPDAPSRTGGRVPLAGREPLIIDAKANAMEEINSHPQLKPATAAFAEWWIYGMSAVRRKSRPGQPLGLTGRRAVGSHAQGDHEPFGSQLPPPCLHSGSTH